MIEADMDYKGHHIHLSRKKQSHDWYIEVMAPDGTYRYDGWWRDSAFTSMDEAIAEAKRGAMIDGDETP